MKATELMIGQTYMSVKWKKPVQLTAEDIYELVHMADGSDISHYIDEFFTPIPLTEEWLLKFGFELKKLDDGREGYINEVGKWEIDNNFWYVIESYCDDYGAYCYVTRKIEYVHQLQNLYFALTDEELPIKT